jgi:hypothetical protein
MLKDLPRTKISLELCGYCLPNFDWKRLSDFLAIHCRSVFASLGILLFFVFFRFVLRSCCFRLLVMNNDLRRRGMIRN